MEKPKRTMAEIFDDHQARYTETVDKAVSFTGLKADFFTKVKAGYLLDLAESTLGPCQQLKVVDIGCGVGNMHPLVAPKFGSLDGIDISSASIARARAHNPGVTYRIYDGARLPYDDGSFDLAYTICVMHHVPPVNRMGFISEMGRVLRPGGLALVFEHNPGNPLTLRAVNACPLDQDAVLLEHGETADLLAEGGIANIVSRFILSIPAGNRPLRTVDRLFSRLPFGAQYYVSGRRR